MNAAIIHLTQVRKSFGAAHVLRDVDLEVAPGEFFGLAGVNGAGKTTLIKCMLDFCAVDAGEIMLFGVPHTHPHARARLVFLPERFVPPYYLTGRDFLAFMLELQQRRYDAAEVEAMIAALDLDPAALVKPVRSYSKGMTQKLGLAACFLAQRDLYVLDEPMSGLDPKARACVKTLLAQLRAEGRTLFFTSHALADIEEICDRMVILHQGVPYFAGAPRTLCEHYGESSMEQAFLRCVESVDRRSSETWRIHNVIETSAHVEPQREALPTDRR
jgi:ABC-2 type transport system ATP-binding protein